MIKNILFFLGISLLIPLLLFFSQSTERPSLPPNDSGHNIDVTSLIKKHIPVNSQKLVKQDLTQYLHVNKFEKSDDSRILIPLSGSDKIWLINRQGELLNDWSIDAERARLLENDSILVAHGSKFRHESHPWNLLKPTAAIYGFNSELLWSYTSKEEIHHDLNMLSNGNVLLLTKAWARNSRIKTSDSALRRKAGLYYDLIQEVTPQGKVVWEWHAIDHIDINDCGTQDCNKRADRYRKKLLNPKNKAQYDKAVTKISDWTHINTLSIIPENKWFDSGDSRFRPGNLMIMFRNFGMLYIIERDSGKVVWKYSGNFKGGLGASHDPQIIPKGRPGAGNILVLDNGARLDFFLNQSYILEINPVTEEIEWVYDAGTKFLCKTRGSVQRLKNGNTFISEDTTGRAFEVDRNGNVLWEFQAPEPINRAYVID